MKGVESGFVAFFATSFSYLMKINIVVIESVESSL